MPRPKQINETSDAFITVTASLPGQPVKDFRMKMQNFIGNTVGEKRKIEKMREVIVNALIKNYGNIVK